MSARSAYFRSHLMQQFASAARHQQRPPMAMLPWLSSSEWQQSPESSSSNEKDTERPSVSRRRHFSATSSLSSDTGKHSERNQQFCQSSTAPVSWNSKPSPTTRITATRVQKATSFDSPDSSSCIARSSSLSLSSVAEDESSGTSRGTMLEKERGHQQLQKKEGVKEKEQQGVGPRANKQDSDRQPSQLAKNFQILIQTRRTTSHFQPISSENHAFWKEALDRAVECARRAPNHKRTEAFSFQRLVSPSAATERLAEIAFRVALQQQKSTEPEKAKQKREKWSHIPAFLVATVSSKKQLLLYNNQNDSKEEEEQGGEGEGEEKQYQPLPFVPPATERDLEDYAASCAAVQNILLSLHAEGIASKWATGPVIQTPAFRTLVNAKPNDRIVALIMIGMPQQTTAATEGGVDNYNKPRRFRKQWEEFLKDL